MPNIANLFIGDILRTSKFIGTVSLENVVETRCRQFSSKLDGYQMELDFLVGMSEMVQNIIMK